MNVRQEIWKRQSVGFLLQDVRYAVRTMCNKPGFTSVTVASLALGIGLCTVIYAFLNGATRALPGVPDAKQLVILQGRVSYPWFETYRDTGKSGWSAAAFLGPTTFSVVADGNTPERVTGILVSPEYFSTLRAEAMFGRVFSAVADKLGSPASVIVTERFWRTRLHSDPQVVGRELRVNGLPVPIAGVCSRGFFGTGTGSFSVPEIFVPVTVGARVAPELRGDALSRTTDPAFWVLFRLAADVTVPVAEARLEVLTRALDKQRTTKGRLVQLVPAGTIIPLPSEFRVVINLFYGVLIAAVLGLTCANLAGCCLREGRRGAASSPSGCRSARRVGA